jgi:hypothetical protein
MFQQQQQKQEKQQRLVGSVQGCAQVPVQLQKQLKERRTQFLQRTMLSSSSRRRGRLLLRIPGCTAEHLVQSR